MQNEYANNYRWVILLLLFAATTINYFDRIVLSFLIPEIKKDLNLDDIDYSHILSAFQFLYTFGFLIAGRVIDWLGTRIGYLLSILAWSIAAGMHGICNAAFCLATWRGVLGLTQSGNFPAAVKGVAEWFHVKDRAFATSMFNSGSTISSILGPMIITPIFLLTGWRMTFFVFGALGILLVLLWLILYKQPSENAAQLPLETHDKNQYSWKAVLGFRATYGIMIGKFLTDPVWWFYLFWMPNYLSSQRNFDLKAITLAIPLIYILATLLGLVGGWLPGFLMRKGWEVSRARKTTMFLCAACLPVSATAVLAHNPWVAVLLVSLACGAHCGWSANIFTLSSDCFPSCAVGSVTGMAGFAGGLGGLLIATLAPGYIVTYFGYFPIFIIMGILHPLAYIAVHFLIKKY